MTQDRFGRKIDYLRISLTDKCNLRCVYCMPEDMTFRPHRELLQDDEIDRLIRLFTQLGFHKFRLTGGEPTIRQGIVPLVERMKAVPGVATIAMTTNGVLLQELAQPLAKAGMSRVNISIDTLDAAKFRKITRWGTVDEVWDGILAAEEAGMEVKLNCVVVRNYNDQQDVIDLARLTLDHPWQVRFIEMMPFGDVAEFQQAGMVSEEELQERISAELGSLTLLNEGQLDGEAQMYRLNGAPGTIGFISSISKPFCASCNRARLTADGKLRLCLLREMEVDLLTPMRAGASDNDMLDLIRHAIWRKPWGHDLEHDIIPLNRVMSEIGG
jgi:cyclic pyranopterin phosphate synthase